MNKFDLGVLKESFGGLRLSLTEWIALGLTIAFAAYVTFFYFNSTQPLQARIQELKRKEKSFQTEIRDDAEKGKLIQDQRNNAGKIVDSLEDFEARLRNRKLGIPAIIDEVTQLAKAHRVKAGDISFRTDAAEPLPADGQPDVGANRNKVEKILNVYEGLGIDTTVEGDYHDLRRFIAALEKSRNFVIINAISLQSVDEKARAKFLNAPPVQGAETAGQPPVEVPANMGGLDAGPTKITVVLKLELETHFSRVEQPEPAVTPVPASAPVGK